jgi:hypothetical protein
VFGYHVTGSTGTLFLYGIVVGAIAGADTETRSPVVARGCRVVGEAAAAVRGTSLAGSDRAYC